jgi:large subunit ribosomal protein L32
MKEVWFMAVPKRKTSKAKRDSRRANTFKLTNPTTGACPQCHKPKLAHRVCKECGFYNGKKVIEVEA